MEDLKQQYLDELKRLSNLKYHDEIKIAELTENFNGISIEIRKKEKLLQQEQWAYLSTHPSKRLTSFCYDDDDDDEDYTSAITPDEPVLSTEEPDNSLSMGDENLDTISATKSDELIKSGVENLILIPSESEGIPEHMCDVPSHDNSPPLDVSKYQIEDFSESNEEFSSINDDSFSIDDIDYVEASPPDSELVSPEVMEIVIPEVGGIDDDILLTIKDGVIREKLLNVNLLISKIEALNANPTPSSNCKTKSSSTSLNSFLEETKILYSSLKLSTLMWKRLVKKLLQQKQWAYLSTHPSKRLTSFCYDDDDEDYTSAITPDEPVLSTEEPEFSSITDDSFSIDDIDYVEASPPDSELVSPEVMEIVIPEVGGIDDDILLMIKYDFLREKLLNVNLLISKIEALNANPTPPSDCKTKSSSTSLNSFLEETNTFDNSLPDPTTHSDSSLYASFIFDLSINPFSPADRSDSYEFTDELIPFISAPEYDCFLFKVEPNSEDFTKDVVEDISATKEP
nr:hypothetical protein [Tanacetum cinerariifolium]